ncbi:MAG: putative toxin-antitoxin system toxin component, PIN family [Candidatus Aenigmarchaeota archaeon]|nr:putative toxin-antitoxin system toxin component, PIN family [Candidatus Aenigmarchaeota archaeon]
MKVVVDTNILISALIKDSITRKILVQSGWTFYYPEESLHEIRKYQNLVLEKSGLNNDDFENLLQLLLKYIVIIPQERIALKVAEAREIMEKQDPKDTIFIAAALSISEAVIWSEDKDFDRQDRIRALKTKDLADILDI